MSRKPRKHEPPGAEDGRTKDKRGDAGKDPDVPLKEVLQKMPEAEREALRCRVIINPTTKGDRS